MSPVKDTFGQEEAIYHSPPKKLDLWRQLKFADPVPSYITS
jgi:hypothetical protein